jgi:hypothetical protein
MVWEEKKGEVDWVTAKRYPSHGEQELNYILN